MKALRTSRPTVVARLESAMAADGYPTALKAASVGFEVFCELHGLTSNEIRPSQVRTALTSKLAEYGNPANHMNAARAGYVAAAQLFEIPFEDMPPLLPDPAFDPKKVDPAMRVPFGDQPVHPAVEALQKIARVNAMDHEYQSWAREALAKIGTDTEPPRDKEHDRAGLPFGIIDPDYARIYTIARCLAWSEDWTICLNGSFTRDLDLLLVPWKENARPDVQYLVQRIAEACNLTINGEPSQRPHGRQTWTLVLPGFTEPRWVDLSAMPTQRKDANAAL